VFPELTHDPQESVFGPLLFILYINDIPHVTQGRPIMYADDTSILNVGQDMNELQNTKQKQTPWPSVRE
jgi:hypothetical protein